MTMTSEIQSIADGIRRRRKELHLTQSDASQRAGVSNTTWSKLERGEWPFSQRTLRSVCEVLDWPVSAIETLRQGEWPMPARNASGDDGDLARRLDRVIGELEEIRALL